MDMLSILLLARKEQINVVRDAASDVERAYIYDMRKAADKLILELDKFEDLGKMIKENGGEV